MPKAQGRTVKKAVSKITKKVVSKSKKLAKSKKKATPKNSILKNATKKVNTFKKKSLKTLSRAKKSAYATEKEIEKYVKENPIKSVSSLALVALIAGFVAKLKK
jgi:ElaB/YqjD/DUF883 family membrane-anchored ribosome-binding protein